MNERQQSVPSIELVYDLDCPHIDLARQAIRDALLSAGAPQQWREWICTEPTTPAELRKYGSPTVLVDRRDVAAYDDGGRAEAATCRVYRDEEGCVCGAPTATQITRAITRARGVV